MSRGRHRTVQVRRPLAPPVVGLAVAATMLAGPLLLAAVPAGTAAPEAPVTPPSVEAVGLSALESALVARDEAQASRGVVRETPAPAATPEPSAAAPAPAPSAAPAPPPPPPPPAVVGELWVTTAVNVRSGPSAGTERVGSLEALAKAGVTGATQDGWQQVVLDGVVGWVNGEYLSETEPVPAAPEPEAAAAAAPSGTSDASCSISSSIEGSLSSNARAVYRAVCAAYGGSVSAFGGFRPGDDGDHGSGHAVDIMVSGSAGWEIARLPPAARGRARHHLPDLRAAVLAGRQLRGRVGAHGGPRQHDREPLRPRPRERGLRLVLAPQDPAVACS